MCGVAGFAGAGDRDDIAAMTAALAHRGPDGESLYCDAELPVYLGHRRLAIIDIAGGKQPMWNEDGDVGVVFTARFIITPSCEKRFQHAAIGSLPITRTPRSWSTVTRSGEPRLSTD